MARTPAMHAYAATKDELPRRLARVEGQVRGMGLLGGHARTCLAPACDESEQADELMATVGRLLRRG